MIEKNQLLNKRHVGIKRIGKDLSWIAVLSTEAGNYAVVSSNKLRVQKAFVHAIYHRNTGKSISYISHPHFLRLGRDRCYYKVKKTVVPDNFDTRNYSCSNGIHFISMCISTKHFQEGWQQWMGARWKANIGDLLAMDRALWEIKNG